MYKERNRKENGEENEKQKWMEKRKKDKIW